MDLLIKVYPNGPMSEHIHSMTPGQMLSFKGPIPKYPWSTNKHSHITLIAGGTGITPMYQLIRKIFKIRPMDPAWSLRSRIEQNPMAWMIQVNGFLVDARFLKREIE